MGDHTESLQIDFNPKEVSYDKLLEVFWKNHSPTSGGSRQYMSGIWFQNENQETLAKASRDALQSTLRDRKIRTVIEPVAKFYLAEDYHQKYFLQSKHDVFHVLKLKTAEDMAHSTIAAKLNSYCGGYCSPANLDAEISNFQLPPQVELKLREIVERKYSSANDGMSCGL